MEQAHEGSCYQACAQVHWVAGTRPLPQGEIIWIMSVDCIQH